VGHQSSHATTAHGQMGHGQMGHGQMGHGLTRRGLLVASAASGALAGLGVAPCGGRVARAVTPDGEVLTGSHWGAYYGRVENGRFVSLRPWEKDPRPSPQLPGVQDVVYSPTRIRYPMVRRAYLENGPNAERASRGAGDFVRVSWDRALDLVAQEIRRVQTDYGPWAVFAGSYGWRSAGKLNQPQPWLQRMMNLAGGFVGASGDYSTGASQVIMPYVVGTIEVYERQTAYPVILQHTDLFVFWGGEPLNNNQIAYAIPDHEAFPWVDAMKQAGKKVIFIDPVRTEACKTLGGEWIAPRPQTDVAMMLGIAHTLYVEKLHNADFLANYTTGFDKFLPYLTGQSDGTPKSAEWAAAICGVPVETIKDLARRFAKGRTMLSSGWSLQRQHHGEQPHWMLVTLAAMLGQIGLPGGGFGLSYHYASGGAPASNSVALAGVPMGDRPAGGKPWPAERGATTIPLARVVDMLLQPGQPFDFRGTRALYPDVRLAYWVGGNPFTHHQQRNRMVEAWRKLDTFIVHDFQWTPTARHADIVLPATTAAERNDIDVVGPLSTRAILAMKQVVEPVFEARTDRDIFAAIATRLGVAAAFTEGRDEMGWIRWSYAAALTQAKSRGIAMPDFDAFWAAGFVEFPIAEAAKTYVRYGDFRGDPVLNPLGTPSGLIEIYSETIAKMHYEDCPPHPTWMEPFERAGAPGTKYPLHVTTKHPPYRLHSQLCGTKLRELYTVQGREPCLINPRDAAGRGIADGDMVRVFNDRGQILAGARLSDDVTPGVIIVSEGGWYDPADPTQANTLCKYGDVNVLSRDIGTSKLAQGNCGHSIVAEAEKYRGTVPLVDVFASPMA
jgi:trimethylamine-N-oxide reductase (cytochrome c)